MAVWRVVHRWKLAALAGCLAACSTHPPTHLADEGGGGVSRLHPAPLHHGQCAGVVPPPELGFC